MAESTSRLQIRPTLTAAALTKRKRTTYQWILIAVGLVVVTLIVGTLLFLMGPGDEQPIRVRNGSMTIELDGGKWEKKGGGSSPSQGSNFGKFVEVVGANGHVCKSGATARGEVVSIMYNDGVAITLAPVG